MFGRMTTSDVMESVESAVSVNHSYSFGQATMDNDYFTVVDNYLSDMKMSWTAVRAVPHIWIPKILQLMFTMNTPALTFGSCMKI